MKQRNEAADDEDYLPLPYYLRRRRTGIVRKAFRGIRKAARTFSKYSEHPIEKLLGLESEYNEASEDQLAYHLTNLHSAGFRDHDRFNVAHDELANDSSVTNADLKHILKNYLHGEHATGHTREHHLHQIRRMWITASRFLNKIGEENDF